MKQHQNLIIPPALLGLVLLLIFFACRKMDKLALTENAKSPVEIRERFFTVPVSADPVVKLIAQAIKKQDAEKNFVPALSQSAGYPRWDKSLVVTGRVQQARIASSPDTTKELVVIPFVQDNANTTGATLLVTVTASDTTYRLVYAYQYADFGFSKKPDSVSAASIFHLFASMDKEVFGHRVFRVRDRRLLADTSGIGQEGEVYAELRSDTATAARIVAVTHCDAIDWCWVWDGDMLCDGGCSTDCPQYSHTTFDCRTTWMDIPGGGGGGSGGGGSGGTWPPGGGGSGGGTGGTGGTGNPGGDPGWEPIELEPDDGDTNGSDPCQTAKDKTKKMDSVFAESDASNIAAGIPGLATASNEFGLPVFQHFSVNPNDVTDTTFGNYYANPGDVSIGTNTGISTTVSIPYLSVYVAWLHTHPPNGYNAPSAKDIYTMIGMSLDNPRYLGSFVQAYNGSQYAFSVTDRNQAYHFFNAFDSAVYLTGPRFNPEMAIGVAFEKAQEFFEDKYEGNPNQRNLAYEMALSSVLSQFNMGVTLAKKDASGEFKPIVVKPYLPNPRKRKKVSYKQECL